MSESAERPQESSFFDDWAEVYNRQSARRDFQDRKSKFAEAGREALRRSDASTPVCIDLGCGPGTITLALAELGFCTIGVDASEAMIDVANKAAAGADGRRRHAQGGMQCSFVCSDLAVFLEEFSGHADFIMSSSVFEYLSDPGHVLRLVSERLTPRGIFAVSIPNRRSVLRRVEPILLLRVPRELRYTSQWRNTMDARALIEASRACNLVPIKTSYFGHFETRGHALFRRWSHHSVIGTLSMIQFAKIQSHAQPARGSPLS